eukprot:TRINITY_DN662_c0_g1_i3.p1 TRINITY_DN662_c0_g1~~TRINITY_DN662_c0_g1_i3.p1  ORF type:complete len:203 (+),score=20.57 TRINITY_DN662_c0_g1_i3:118-726(+)
MRNLVSERSIKIPKGVTIKVKSRCVVVEGPRGTLSRNFRHQSAEIFLTGKGKHGYKRCTVRLFLGKKKQRATVRSILSHIQNMVTGVTKGFRYKMRLVYAHFPINVTIVDKVTKEVQEIGDLVEIRNFLGERRTRRVEMLGGVVITRSEIVKDELILEGNDIDNVSQSAATIQQSTLVRNKDIRKFLDGIYVSQKGEIREEL